MIRDLSAVVPPETSSVARECLAFAQESDVDVEELSRRVSQDIGLTVDLMKVANSAALGGLRQVKTVKEAVSRIGLMGVRQILSDHALRNSVQFEPSGFFNFADFSRHSAFVGLLAHELCLRVDKPQAQVLHLAGLLHEVGLGVIAAVDREHVHTLTDNSVRHGRLFEDVESTLGLIPHRVVGAHVLELWKLPLEVCKLVKVHDVRSHILRGQISKEEHRLVDLLLLADSLGHSRYARLEPIEEDESFASVFSEKIGINGKDLMQACANASDLLETYFPSQVST